MVSFIGKGNRSARRKPPVITKCLKFMFVILGPSQPRNLQVLFSNSSLVTLEWEIPAETNGQIRKYQIWYKVKQDNSGNTGCQMFWL